MNKYRLECKHHPIAQKNGLIRLVKFIIHRKKTINCFRCASCGVDLRIPSAYTCASLKIGYLLFSILISIGMLQAKLMYGVHSVISNFLSVCFLYLLMHLLQIVTSAAILAFCSWGLAADENDAQIQFEIMRKQDTDFCLLWMLGISLSVGYIVGLAWWVLLIVIIAIICILVARRRNE